MLANDLNITQPIETQPKRKKWNVPERAEYKAEFYDEE